jgi:hypothetical protein
VRRIRDYDGTSKIATVVPDWTTQPQASSSTFAILPASSAWDELRADHATSGTFGQGVAGVQGNVTGSVNSVTTAVALPTGNDVYHADISMDIDNTNTRDEYTVVCFKNGLPLTGLTQATNNARIYIINRDAELVAETTMSDVNISGSPTGYFKYNATGTGRLAAGETAIVRVKVNIDGADRTFVREIPRNS